MAVKAILFELISLIQLVGQSFPLSLWRCESYEATMEESFRHGRYPLHAGSLRCSATALTLEVYWSVKAMVGRSSLTMCHKIAAIDDIGKAGPEQLHNKTLVASVWPFMVEVVQQPNNVNLKSC